MHRLAPLLKLLGTSVSCHCRQMRLVTRKLGKCRILNYHFTYVTCLHSAWAVTFQSDCVILEV